MVVSQPASAGPRSRSLPQRASGGTGNESARDPLGLFARIVMHIPEPRRHVIRYNGAYPSVVRARRIRQAAAAGAGGVAPGPPPVAHGHRRVTATPRPPESRTARGTSPAEPRPPLPPPGAPPGACLQIRTSTCSDHPSPRRSGLRSPPSGYHRRLDSTSIKPYHPCSEKGDSYR